MAFDAEEQLDQKAFRLAMEQSLQRDLRRFGEATSECFKIHDYLQKISSSKLNAEYLEQNLMQQRGFSAEAVHVARSNSENVINGNSSRLARLDDMGHVNHTQADVARINTRTHHVVLDADGSFVGAGQMKMHSTVEKYSYLHGSPDIFEKYAAMELVVPSDQFDDIVRSWSDNLAKLEKQLKNRRAAGDEERARHLQEKIDRLKSAKRRLRSAKISTEEAMDARLHPTKTVLKDSARVAHLSGIEGAKVGALWGGGASALSNVSQILLSDKEIDEAIVEVMLDTGKAAATSYGITYATTMVSGVMQASSKQVLQNIGKSNLPVTMIQTGVILAKNALMVAKGEMTAEQFVVQITREGCMLGMSMAGSALGGMLGGMAVTGLALAGPGLGILVGGMIGGMVASMLSGSLYNALQESVRSLEASDQLRCETKKMCDRLLADHHAYQAKLQATFSKFFSEKEVALQTGFDALSTALLRGESIHNGLQQIAAAMGVELRFETTGDLKTHLRSRQTLQL
ncbi:hypothetical protein ACLSSQ_13025 [Azospira sp. APE16]|uniref:hypothetical protein n=1 Tax=Azospira sp. APE16 TaxID=3394231 RepID=UPI003A4D94EE